MDWNGKGEMIQIPEQIPGLRWLKVGLAGYFVLWVVLEGDLNQTVLLGISSCMVAVVHLIERWGRGRVVSRKAWLMGLAGIGSFVGVCSGLATLAFMAVKTGLHAHGPEFTPAEIAWVWQMIPLWAIVGATVGMALASILIGFQESGR